MYAILQLPLGWFIINSVVFIKQSIEITRYVSITRFIDGDSFLVMRVMRVMRV